jgi:hypothetical protein
MHRHKAVEQTAYYRREAAACATAAATPVIAEIKQAYLDLEQGWLCLAPKVEASPTTRVDPSTAHDADLKPSRAPHDKGADDVIALDDLQARLPLRPMRRSPIGKQQDGFARVRAEQIRNR